MEGEVFMSEVTAGIVAHEQRRLRVNQLYQEMADYFPTTVFFDDGHLGCSLNHLQTWEAIATDATTEWCMVVEDDVAPIRNLGYHLGQALFYSPAPVVSLYLGRGRPAFAQPKISRAVQQPRPWVIGTRLLHCVAVCVRTELVMGMLTRAREAITSPVGKPIDEAITEWLQENCLPVAYTNPSLVDHADLPSIASPIYAQPARDPRVAWRVGVPDAWTGQFSVI